MADVRLTATNPEDSTVVPVACNAKGELKLEEIPDQSFDGNLDGDLTVSGGAQIGAVTIADAFSWSNINTSASGFWSQDNWRFGGDPSNSSSYNIKLDATGTVEFKGNVYVGSAIQASGRVKGSYFETVSYYSAIGVDSVNQRVIKFGSEIVNGGYIDFVISKTTLCDQDTDLAQVSFSENLRVSGEYGTLDVRGSIRNRSSGSFANGAAGFTAEGHLWCKTRRGDTVILDSTSNGLGVWEPYDLNKVAEKLEEWAEKNVLRPKPEESSQDGPATQQ